MDIFSSGERFFAVAALCAIALMAVGCGAPPTTTNAANANINSNNLRANANTNANMTSSAPVDTGEPSKYQATISLKLEAVGSQQTTALPTLSATVARNGDDRRMEFVIPAGGHVIYLDKGGNNYLILPDKKQYAEINKESTGFEVRRMLMPEQIVNEIKKVQGLERVGEETYNGRQVVRYRYAATANTQTRAGQVQTDSFLLVDKETGLPVHSETGSQASGNVQGYNGIRVITDMSDIKTDVPADEFEGPPAGFQKIDPEQVRAQVDLVFNALATVVSQILKQGQPAPSSPAASPTR